MKRIIILLCIIYSFYCGYESCYDETRHSECSKISIEIDGFSCYKYSFEDKDNQKEEGCTPFPDDDDDQKYFEQLLIGMGKETMLSIYEDSEDAEELNYIPTFDKESYKKDEIIVTKMINITKEDKEKRERNNTCLYKYYYYTLSQEDGPLNVTDKNICFNVEQYDELKNKLGCGYATIKFIKEGKVVAVLNTCYFIPDKNTPDTIENFIKKFYYDVYFSDYPSSAIIIEYKKNFDNSTKKRKLQNAQKSGYEMIIEDRNGRKLKYTSDSDEPIKINGSSYSNYKINFILLLLLLFI